MSELLERLRTNLELIDADTLRTGDTTVRITDLDAPEAPGLKGGGYYQPGEAGHDVATEWMAQALPSVDKAEAQGSDRYGRLVANLERGGESIGTQAIRAGVAHPTLKFSDGEQDRAMVSSFIARQRGNRTTWDDKMDAARAANPPRINFGPTLDRAYRPEGTWSKAVDRGWANLKASVGAAGNYLGEKLGIDALSEGGADMAANAMVEAALNPAEVESFEDAETLSEYGTWALEKIGENLPNMATMIGSAGVGGLATAGVGKALLKKAVADAAKKSLSPKWATWGARIGAVGATYPIHMGEAWQELRDAGVNPEDTNAPFLTAAINTVLDVAPMEGVLRYAFKGLDPDMAKDLVKQATKQMDAKGILAEVAKGAGRGAAAGFAMEAPTELTQEIVNLTARAYHDPEFSWDDPKVHARLKEAFAAGGVVGAAMGGSGRASTQGYRALKEWAAQADAGIEPGPGGDAPAPNAAAGDNLVNRDSQVVDSEPAVDEVVNLTPAHAAETDESLMAQVDALAQGARGGVLISENQPESPATQRLERGVTTGKLTKVVVPGKGTMYVPPGGKAQALARAVLKNDAPRVERLIAELSPGVSADVADAHVAGQSDRVVQARDDQGRVVAQAGANAKNEAKVAEQLAPQGSTETVTAEQAFEDNRAPAFNPILSPKEEERDAVEQFELGDREAADEALFEAQLAAEQDKGTLPPNTPTPAVVEPPAPAPAPAAKNPAPSAAPAAEKATLPQTLKAERLQAALEAAAAETSGQEVEPGADPAQSGIEAQSDETLKIDEPLVLHESAGKNSARKQSDARADDIKKATGAIKRILATLGLSPGDPQVHSWGIQYQAELPPKALRPPEITPQFVKALVRAAWAGTINQENRLPDVKTPEFDGLKSIGVNLNLPDLTMAGLGLLDRSFADIESAADARDALLGVMGWLTERGWTFPDVLFDKENSPVDPDAHVMPGKGLRWRAVLRAGRHHSNKYEAEIDALETAEELEAHIAELKKELYALGHRRVWYDASGATVKQVEDKTRDSGFRFERVDGKPVQGRVQLSKDKDGVAKSTYYSKDGELRSTSKQRDVKNLTARIRYAERSLDKVEKEQWKGVGQFQRGDVGNLTEGVAPVSPQGMRVTNPAEPDKIVLTSATDAKGNVQWDSETKPAEPKIGFSSNLVEVNRPDTFNEEEMGDVAAVDDADNDPSGEMKFDTEQNQLRDEFKTLRLAPGVPSGAATPTATAHVLPGSTTKSLEAEAGKVAELLNALDISTTVTLTDAQGAKAKLDELRAGLGALEIEAAKDRKVAENKNGAQDVRAAAARRLEKTEAALDATRHNIELLERTIGKAKARVLFMRTPDGKHVSPLIYLGASLKGMARKKALLHEVGHIVLRAAADGASPEAISALREALGGDDYTMFEENFANAFLMWAEKKALRAAIDPASQRIKDLVVEFFDKLWTKLRKLWLEGKEQLEVDETFAEFMEGVINRKRRREGEKEVLSHSPYNDWLASMGRTRFLRYQPGAADALDFTPADVARRTARRALNNAQVRKLGRASREAGKFIASIHDRHIRGFAPWLHHHGVGWLADDFKVTPGRARKPGQTIPMRMRSEGARFINRITKLADDFGPKYSVKSLLTGGSFQQIPETYRAVQRALVNETSIAPDQTGHAEWKAVREVFDSLHTWLRGKGVRVAYRSNYFPFIFGKTKLREAGAREAFAEAVVRWAKVVPEEARLYFMANNLSDTDLSKPENIERRARQLARGLYDMAITDGMSLNPIENANDFEIMSPGFDFKGQRRLPPGLVDALTQFREDDVFETLFSYAHAAVKRGVWQERYGLNEVLAEIEAKFAAAHAGEIKLVEAVQFQKAQIEAYKERGVDIYDPAAKLVIRLQDDHKAGQISDDDLQFILDKIIPGLQGRLGADMNPVWRRFQAFMLVYQNWRVLSMGVFAQTIDFGLVLNNARGVRFEALRSALKVFVDKNTREELMRLAHDLGAVRDDTMEHILNDESGVTLVDARLRRLNEALFRWNGMHKLTNIGRAWALGVGKTYLHHIVRTNAADEAARLGVTIEQIKDWMADHEPTTWSERHDAVQGALHQFIDEGILRPDAGSRPVLGNDQRFALFWHLKSFPWEFTHTVLMRHVEDMKKRWGEEEGLRKAAALMPMLTLAAFSILFAGLGMELRWLIAPPAKRPEGGWDYAIEAIQRSGMTGYVQLLIDADTATEHHRFPLFALLGPSVSQLDELWTKGSEYDPVRALPAYAAVRGAASLVERLGSSP